uniref:LCN-type CS-alpha/beta domain-containing protein n=1 Tax=Isometrus maculatus TaxID=497827 RepID=A0A0U1S870_ISOMC|nr:hypothetical protein [Isometrus maculatus]
MKYLILVILPITMLLTDVISYRLEEGYPVAENGCRISCIPNDQEKECKEYCTKNGATNGFCDDDACACLCDEIPDDMTVWLPRKVTCESWNQNLVTEFLKD